MKLFGGILVLIMGITISIVAAWFSVTGMVALFNANAMGVMAMMISLEAGKLVGASWLKFNWKNPNVAFLHRAYLLCAVCVLSLITSLGIYGYLAAGHLEQAAPQANISVQVQPLQLQLQQKNDENARLGQRLNQIDQNIAVFLKNDQASKGLKASGSLKKERDDIQAKIDTNNTAINDLNTKLAPLKMQNNEVEAKLGPVKYFAALVGMGDDSAVRLVICLIVSVFDVFAVVLLLSAMTTFREWMDGRPVNVQRIDWYTRPVRGETEEGDDKIDEPKDEPKEEPPMEEAGVPEPEPELVDDDTTEPEKAEAETEAEPVVDQPNPELLAAHAHIERLKTSMDSSHEDHLRDVEMVLEHESAEKEALLAQVAALQARIIKLEKSEPEPEPKPISQIPGGVHVPLPEVMLEQPPEDIIDVQPVDPKEVDRDTLIGILERHPRILNEIEAIVEKDVVEELTDREKLLDLLEKNPSIINDMAEIFASQITRSDKPVGDDGPK